MEHKVILVNAAGIRSEFEFVSIEEACGSCGPKMPLLYNGKAGYFEFEAVNSTKVKFVETDQVMQWFAYAHLPPHLQEVSRRFYEMAEWIFLYLPRNQERTKALNDLLTAKDAAVRARLTKQPITSLVWPEAHRPCS